MFVNILAGLGHLLINNEILHKKDLKSLIYIFLSLNIYKDLSFF